VCIYQLPGIPPLVYADVSGFLPQIGVTFELSFRFDAETRGWLFKSSSYLKEEGDVTRMCARPRGFQLLYGGEPLI
jgi:hypothetical protein